MASPAFHIAVVDDEHSVRAMLCRVLRLEKYSVEAFASGHEFLASLKGRVPDCAVLDIHMAGIDGLEVLRQTSRLQAGMPVILITASDDTGLDRSARDAGALVLLRKPFASEDLLRAIAQALS